MLRRPIKIASFRERPARPTLSRARLFFTWTLFFLSLFSMVTLWWVDRQLSRPLREWAELQVRNMGQQAVTEAMKEILGSSSGHSDTEFIRQLPVTTDGTAAWQYDWTALHRLEAEITSHILHRLNSLGDERIAVPLGQLLGIDVLAGAGPMLPVRFLPGGAIATEVEFVFTSVGINQVLHEIALRIHLQMRVIAPMVSDRFDVQHRIPLSTVVLQGRVPQVFVEWKSGTMEEFIEQGLAARIGG